MSAQSDACSFVAGHWNLISWHLCTHSCSPSFSVKSSGMESHFISKFHYNLAAVSCCDTVLASTLDQLMISFSGQFATVYFNFSFVPIYTVKIRWMLFWPWCDCFIAFAVWFWSFKGLANSHALVATKRLVFCQYIKASLSPICDV